MITTLFGKKKITEDKLSNVFVNAVLELTENGFPVVADEVNESPEFEVSPNINPADDARFAMVVLTGNLIEMERLLGPGLDRRIFALSISKFAQTLGRPGSELEEEVHALKSRMERLNFPSKSTARGMSAVLFREYDLFCYQDIYFREQRSPNPIILKRLTNLMGYFLWSWNDVMEQYRVV